ncbi:MAG: hypothetical protein G8D91_21795 [gamma proteobacterium symbiont of Clathrolucina costata]
MIKNIFFIVSLAFLGNTGANADVQSGTCVYDERAIHIKNLTAQSAAPKYIKGTENLGGKGDNFYDRRVIAQTYTLISAREYQEKLPLTAMESEAKAVSPR